MRRRPNRCPACDLTWNAYHGQQFGYGYLELGARVWRCTRCREMQKGSVAHHQSVFRS